MAVKNQYFIVLTITLSLFIGNSEAGWKFWKKETTTTMSTTLSVNVQSTTASTKPITDKKPTMSIVNTEAAKINAANPGLDIIETTRESIRNNVRSNSKTEFGTDIDVSRSNKPGISHGDSQSYRNLATDFIAKESSQNQPSKIQGSTINNVVSTTSSIRADQNKPSTQPSGKTWADIAAIGVVKADSPTNLPRPPEYPVHPASGENRGRTTSERSTQPIQLNQNKHSTSSKDVRANAVAEVTTKATIGVTRMYSSNPTYSKGNIVTDEDLEKLSEALYIKDINNVNQYITVNLQKQTTSSNLMDQASQPLLVINPEAFQISTIQKVLSIYDNYQLDTHTNEYINPLQRQEESLLVDTFLSTNVMSAAMRFLADKGFVRQDYYEYKDTLRRIWFNLFSRGQGKIGSTGFEHVFMAETKQVDAGTEVLGLHNWIYFNAEEIKKRVDYLGYIKKIDLGNKGSIIKMHVKFNGYDKPVTTMFIGISPELEMSLYTVCFYARPDGNCPVSLGGTKFNIITHKFRYRGKDLIGTAYPEI
ncbi:poly(U)-specific endoribonuclease homolog [Camponotus floridanus]|uniref:poly(U)-specific endoribonuclease homolog n=1 Tax=Camponotus floridanus TaxID=104421 RepID=UPI000DC69ED7|nr:poly(U)-specific endoribonuclease homolog [Camponotus floridanus]XP_011261935.2 poly(U)-specific endoribonuclease homolog [Camponotus floridanus]